MTRMFNTLNRGSRGFTLLELVITIILTGAIVAMVSLFLVAPIENYFDVELQGEMNDTADTALRKMARDLRSALPNSVRTRNADTNCIEFMPTTAGARYRRIADAAGQFALDFDTATTTFDYFGTLTPTPAANDYVVVYNMGINGADAYRNQNISAINNVDVANGRITLQNPTLFPFASPSRRFQIVSGTETAVTYTCSGGNLYRYVGTFGGGGGKYAIQADPSASSCPTPPAGTPILATNVSTCVFQYAPAVTARNGLASLQLGLTKNNAAVTLYHEVHVDNVP